MPETKPTQSCDDNHYRISNLDLTFGTPISENAGFLLVTEMPGALQRDKSTIRSQLDLQFDSKYDGKKISRTDLENSASNDDELSEEDYEFDNEMQSMEESENEYAMAESENEYSAELGMDDNASDDENQGDGTLDIIAQLAKQDEDNENMLQNIQASTKKDTEKGAQVRNQVKLWESLLDIRIRLQKALDASNTLPQPEKFDTITDSEVLENAQQIQQTAFSVLDRLIDLRQTMFEHNAESAKNVPIAELKRKRGSADVNTILNDVLVPMRAGFETFQNESIETWNAKIQLGNGVQMQKKFKVLNQSIVSQIKTVLADRPRLIKRTQLMRSAYNIIGKEKIADANPTDANDQVDSYDTEIFDDGDYYQQLLKELIESRMGDHEDPVQMALKLAQLKQLQNQKSRKTVDTKASKGRKIRYQVQEKIQNFMAAEPRGTWHDEMIQELFSTLFGMNFDTLATAPAVAKADGFTLI